MKSLLCCAVLLVSSIPVLALPICKGGDRAERKLTCIVDGDTGWERGVKWRLLDIDTPETSQPECQAELRIGIAARDRLRELMSGGYRIVLSGDQDRSGRELVDVQVSGRDAGAVLIAEDLAQPWPNKGNVWCGR